MNSALRHPVVNIKKVARMSSKERQTVLKELRKHVGKRLRGSVSNGVDSSSNDTSQASVNKDWQN